MRTNKIQFQLKWQYFFSICSIFFVSTPNFAGELLSRFSVGAQWQCNVLKLNLKLQVKHPTDGSEWCSVCAQLARTGNKNKQVFAVNVCMFSAKRVPNRIQLKWSEFIAWTRFAKDSTQCTVICAQIQDVVFFVCFAFHARSLFFSLLALDILSWAR